jgi:hypothetical protein
MRCVLFARPCAAPETWRGARRFAPDAPSSSVSPPVSRVLYGPHRKRCERDDHSSATPVARRLKQPTRTADPDRSEACASRRSYSVLLPVGFTVPPTLPPTRCALTAPFHPCPAQYATRTRRSAFLWHCPWASIPLARHQPPAGRYPAPCVRGARTFLPGALSSVAGAAVQPTDIPSNGELDATRQVSLRLSRAPVSIMVSGCCIGARDCCVSSRARKVISVDESSTPSIRAGRKWRWKAATTQRVFSS